MEQGDSRYTIAGVDVFDVRNRNELRIVEKLQEMVEQMGEPVPSAQAIRDAYALALNFLPPRYKQGGTIVLREPIRENHLCEAASRALSQVLAKPKP